MSSKSASWVRGWWVGPSSSALDRPELGSSWSLFWTGSALFLLFATFMILVQFATPNLAGNDGYYHIQMAYLMRTAGLKLDFAWLPLTVLNPGEFVDHHFLYHVLLIPFTFGDLRVGAKLASALFPSLTFLLVWWTLRKQRVPFAALWAAGLLIISEAFIYRMSMPRTQSLSLGVLVLAVHWLLTGRFRRLAPLAFFFVWLYDAFPLIIVVSGIYVVARWVVDRQLEWRPLAYASLGVGVGLLINPYFPENLLFIFRHLAPKLLDPTATRVGNEWYPYKTTQLIENSGVTWLMLLSGVFALGLRPRRMDSGTATALLMSFLFGAMLFQSRRFVEYFPPFVLVFAALAWRPILITALDDASKRPATNWRKWLAVGLMLALCVPVLWTNLQASQTSLQDSKPYQRYEQASAWLVANTPAGSRVFQTDWDDFPRLFFYNTHNTYTLGLDPTYMQLKDPELFDLWVDIGKGRTASPAQAIEERFGAEYVFTDLGHRAFLEQAGKDSGLEEVYRDQYAAVFRVLSSEAGNVPQVVP